MKATNNLLIITFLVFINSSVYSQFFKGGDGYKSSIGVRSGTDFGGTFKHFLNDKLAFEGILSTNLFNSGSKITGLLEYHIPFNGVQGLNWLFGGGIHAGFHNASYYDGYYYDVNGYYYNSNGQAVKYKSSYFAIGLDGIFGAEYNLANYPFTFQADVKPYFDIINRGNNFLDISISARYIFNK